MNTDGLAYVALGIILFLLGREFVCWYFKINHRLDVLEEIRDLLKEGKDAPTSIQGKENSRVMKVSDGEISIINTEKK